jgi:two-component system phosphate regulon sensor histidine kinase PhoR
MSEPLPARRVLVAAVTLAAPTWLALAVAAVGGWIVPQGAALIGLLTFAVSAVLGGVHLRHMARLADYLRRLAQGGDPAVGRAPPGSRGAVGALAPDLGAAVAEAGRAWSERRRELEAVVSANETIFASLPDPLIMLAGDRRVVRANRAAEALFGEPLRGRELTALLRAPPLLEAVEAALQGGPGRRVELVLPVPVERSLQARIEPLPTRLADGTVVLITLSDVTSIKRAEQMRADFVANASHELRTPLSTLIGFIETLSGPARDDAEARDRFLAIMLEQARRMARLVNDLLSLSRIELNEHRPPTQPVELARVVAGVVDTLHLKAAGKRMAILLDAEAPAGVEAGLEGLPPVIGDPDELAQLVQNLVDNALKYGRSGTPVRISAWRVPLGPDGRPSVRTPSLPRRLAQNAVALSVADEGEGIAREHIPRLTERFYRVDTARSRDLGGTGLGLAIVKHIVNRHRGVLDIESHVGKGSRFTVYLPAAAG